MFGFNPLDTIFQSRKKPLRRRSEQCSGLARLRIRTIRNTTTIASFWYLHRSVLLLNFIHFKSTFLLLKHKSKRICLKVQVYMLTNYSCNVLSVDENFKKILTPCVHQIHTSLMHTSLWPFGYFSIAAIFGVANAPYIKMLIKTKSKINWKPHKRSCKHFGPERTAKIDHRTLSY